jgi:hypothetical protein
MMTRLAKLLAVAALIAAASPGASADPDERKGLSEAQVAKVVKTHFGDIQSCWNQVPAKDRAGGASLVLGMSIGPKGEICDLTLIGTVPADARSCMADHVRRWQFPEADLASDVEVPIELRER